MQLVAENYLDRNSKINYTFIGRQGQHFKKRVYFCHAIPGIKSEISIKAVLFDDSSFDIEAILKINKGAVNTDSFLSIKVLQIGKNAFARVVPSLEINESDVKGGHGAVISYIDESEMFYLKSRGIKPKNAEKILIKSFLKN